MQIIEKIEIKSFRSFGNRKNTKTQISKLKDLNIFSGANDSGKSNILRALNLFFNKRTNLSEFLNFGKDFFKREFPDEQDVKQELITIKISFWNEKNKGINKTHKDYTRLPEKFWVSRKWLKTSEFSGFQQDDGVHISFKTEKENNWTDFYESDEKTLKPNVRANLSKQLTDFLDSIQYHYIPAIKDREYFSHLYGELQQTLLKESNSSVNKNKVEFQDSIQKSTQDLMEEFKNVINNEQVNITAAFELPNLINLFRTLNVQTNAVSLDYRGDGIQAKLIPEILYFIASKELSIRPSKIVKGEKAKKYFIWGFEEPENSYEYKNAQLLADRFKYIFSNKAQIFLTTHSFNFLSINGDNVSTFRVWKDNEIESSKVSKVKISATGEFQFESNELKNDTDRLNEELGIFQLNKKLEELYLELENEKIGLHKKLVDIACLTKKITKPIIISEGNNKTYIEKAKKLLEPNLDFNVFELKEFGDKEILKLFNFLLKTRNHEPKILFVVDCDATDSFLKMREKQTEYLIPFIFENNGDNLIIKKGIENLFNCELINLDEHYKEEIIPDDYGGSITKKLFDKNKFEKFICQERNNIEDFRNFTKLFEVIKTICEERDEK